MAASTAHQGHHKPRTAPQPSRAPSAAPDGQDAFTRAILGDRYDGLLMDLRPRAEHMVGDAGPLLVKLDGVLWALIAGVSRRNIEDDDGDLVEELEATIRSRVIDWAMAHPVLAR